ncbi:FAD dependent oxidoreductase-domain-containing protein [Limtongia smithiae]|uniref:FAD dependent oxidoreductase-domain-containing protein n=1 Tax=Limtongia smithiae TaxID=1125753 RepID=UPI0034CEA3DB
MASAFRRPAVRRALFAAASGLAASAVILPQSNSRLRADAVIATPLSLPIPPRHPPPTARAQQIARLGSDEFDLLVIGAGASGAGVALDAAARGLKVALVERDDFSCGTSSRSTKLVHGGVRYLEKAFWNLDYEQYKLVKEALAERATFLTIAPHLSFALPIMVPVYTWWQIPYYWAGTKAYDLLAGRENMASSFFMTRSAALDMFPLLKPDDLKGGIVYYDGSHNDARMNVSLALTAADNGAVVLNHMEITELTKDPATGAINGAVARDTDGGFYDKIPISAKVVVNATGPFTDAIRKLDTPVAVDIVAPSSGTHLILPDYYCPSSMGMIDPQTSDGRVIFFLPWQGQTLAGTTDAPTAVAKDPVPTEEEIDWILKEIRGYLSSDITVKRDDVLAAWTGIRPLVRDPAAKSTESLVRNHLVTVSESGLVTVAGGKWTTYREMAQDTVDACVTKFGLTPKAPCSTKTLLLNGAHGYRSTLHVHLIQAYGIETDIAKHLAANYGDRAYDVLELCSKPAGRWPVTGLKLAENYPYVDGEIKYAVRNEYARTAIDVLARRTRLAFLNYKAALESLPMVIDVMGDELAWDKARKEKEWTSTVKYLHSMGLPADQNWTRAQVEAGALNKLH